MTGEIIGYFQELAAEFSSIQHKVIVDPRLYFGFRTGSYPAPGSERYGKGFTIQSEACFKANLLTQALRLYTRSFISTQKIFDYFVRERLWFREVENIETDFNTSPFISQNIISGFLARNFELNQYKLVCTPASIAQALAELDAYLGRDYIELRTLLALHGPFGDLEELSLSKNVSLKRADFRISRLFGLYYSDWDNHYVEMFEGDYVLDINFRVPKKDVFAIASIENATFDAWFHVPLLAKVGNIEMGKRVRTSNDWPAVLTSASHAILWQSANPYGFHFKSQFCFENGDAQYLSEIASKIEQVDFHKLDDRIKYSIERFRKAKSCRDINDKVIELALALEYLINTVSYEVTLQLALKSLKLLHDDNADPTLYRSLKAFYGLRSKVVHGNEKIANDPKNINMIDSVEKTVQQMILRFIELNAKYTFKRINEALDKSLYISRPLLEILEKH
jgi:Apea-like HEPN